MRGSLSPSWEQRPAATTWPQAGKENRRLLKIDQQRAARLHFPAPAIWPCLGRKRGGGGESCVRMGSPQSVRARAGQVAHCSHIALLCLPWSSSFSGCFRVTAGKACYHLIGGSLGSEKESDSSKATQLVRGRAE